MPRPRTITDEHLLAATVTLIDRRGPGFTLAEVAEEAGVSVGTVAQRFGSRNGLLQAVTKAESGQVARRMRTVAGACGSPLDGLRAALVDWYGRIDDPEIATNNLAALGMDLLDPTLRGLLADHFAAIDTAVRAMVRAAAPELPGAPSPARAARVLTALVNGIALEWSVRPKGRLADRVRHDVNAVLAGWSRPVAANQGEGQE
ncbi:TetR/AcrR family transcriptional regulator [Solihabitans fulvus]|uniref:TetR/AcrR family transcriptional regulator n=1 Tax=Solihabitans fulvus TaxID=1892852 RepID=A0A5B2WM07_9PSEU|nr:TetR/AcrR family transcriptional regulator [Solihabitans fulvus]KAA2251449.1 TetR/AcrR family transcriptional regulator [Solihabitans fulvus]